MRLLYELYALLLGGFDNLFFVAREKIRTKFSALLHGAGSRLTYMRRLAFRSVAKLREGIAPLVKAAMKNVLHFSVNLHVSILRRLSLHFARLRLALPQFRVTSGGIAIKPTFKFVRDVFLRVFHAARHVPEHIRLRLRLASMMIQGISKHITPEKQRITISTKSPVTVGRTKIISTTIFARFKAIILITIRNMRRCVSRPKTWWKYVVRIRGEPRKSHLRLWLLAGTAKLILHISAGFARINHYLQAHFVAKMRTGIAQKIHPGILQVRLFLDAKKIRVGIARKIHPGILQVRLFLDAKKIRAGSTVRISTVRFSFRYFFSALQTAGTAVKAVLTGFTIQLISGMRTLGTLIALRVRIVSDAARLFLRTVGQRVDCTLLINLVLRLFAIRADRGIKIVVTPRSTFRQSTALSSWIFPRENGDDLFIAQAYAVTETAQNIFIT